MFRITFTLLLLLLCLPVKASLISVGFSGTIEQDLFNVPEDTIVFGSFTFDPNASYQEFGGNKHYFVSSASISALGDTATISSGYINVNSNRLHFSAGPFLGLSGVFGNTETFSNTLNGIVVGGMGFSVTGIFIDDVLPTSGDQIYGATGTFFINRSIGTLFDVDAPDLLQLPIPNANVSEPNLLVLLLCVCMLMVWRRSTVR